MTQQEHTTAHEQRIAKLQQQYVPLAATIRAGGRWQRKRFVAVQNSAGETFETMTDAAKKYKVTVPAIMQAVRRGRTCRGLRWFKAGRMTRAQWLGQRGEGEGT